MLLFQAHCEPLLSLFFWKILFLFLILIYCFPPKVVTSAFSRFHPVHRRPQGNQAGAAKPTSWFVAVSAERYIHLALPLFACLVRTLETRFGQNKHHSAYSRNLGNPTKTNISCLLWMSMKPLQCTSIVEDPAWCAVWCKLTLCRCCLHVKSERRLAQLWIHVWKTTPKPGTQCQSAEIDYSKQPRTWTLMSNFRVWLSTLVGGYFLGWLQTSGNWRVVLLEQQKWVWPTFRVL